MNSYLTQPFVDCYRKLPEHVRSQARRNYQIWKENPQHPSLQFKKVHTSEPIYSVRVGIGWRALGVVDNEINIIAWFWIGSHADYDHLLKNL